MNATAGCPVFRGINYFMSNGRGKKASRLNVCFSPGNYFFSLCTVGCIKETNHSRHLLSTCLIGSQKSTSSFEL